MISFNDKLKQLLFLSLLLGITFLAIRELWVFMPGLLGAITLYILFRGSFYQLVYHRGWKKTWAAWLFLVQFILILGVVVYGCIVLLGPKLQPFLNDPAMFLNRLFMAMNRMQQKSGLTLFSQGSATELTGYLTRYIPALITDSANLVGNLAILLFVLYYMLVHGKYMEKFMAGIIPLQQGNVHLLTVETKRYIKASAIGIPLISVIQGMTAMLGYVLFGLHDYVLWGFVTAVFAFFPVVGTMIVWVPLVLFMYAVGDSWNGTGLLLYSLLVTGNVDYLARITLLRKIGQVHPVVTVLGVIVGLGLFGFVGLIFGPLLVNYVILLFNIYNSEFIAAGK